MQIKGIVHRSRLRARGVMRGDLERWAVQGAVASIQPWYVTADAPADLVALLRLGVRPTCLDAAALHGLWIPPHPGTHVFRPRSSARREALDVARARQVRRRDGLPWDAAPLQPLVLHTPEGRFWPDADPVPDLSLVLTHAGHCLPVVKTAVLLESALHRGLATRHEVDRIIASLPHRKARSLVRVRSDAESGTETTVRWWFESIGVSVRPQVRFPDGRRRMDLLVGRSWVIECDSREFHDDPVAYDDDRERDLHLAAHGYRVTRLTWSQVFLRWDRTEQMLRAILGLGEHLLSPRPGAGNVLAE